MIIRRLEFTVKLQPTNFSEYFYSSLVEGATLLPQLLTLSSKDLRIFSSTRMFELVSDWNFQPESVTIATISLLTLPRLIGAKTLPALHFYQ